MADPLATAGKRGAFATMRQITPSSIMPPFGAYSHRLEVPVGRRLLATSGQLGIAGRNGAA